MVYQDALLRFLALIYGLNKQLLHCMSIMRVCVQQTLQNLAEDFCPLLLPWIQMHPDTPPFLAQLEYL